MWSRLFNSENPKTLNTINQKALDMLLHHSLNKDSLPTIEICIDKGADLASTVDGLTVMERAVLSQEWEVVQLIASKKKDSSNQYKYTVALESAISHNQESAAIALIVADTNLDQDIKSLPPKSILHFAIDKKNPQIIEHLIKKNPALLAKNYIFLHGPLGHAADMANQSITKMDAQQYWDIVQLMIPFAKTAMEKETKLIMPWERIYGFEAVLAYAAKHGNTQIMLSLFNAGISLNVYSFDKSSKSVLDKAAKYNQFTTAALSLYLNPGLENRNRLMRNYSLQNSADININIIEHGKLWAKNFRNLIGKCTFLLEILNFASCSRDLYPLFFMNLVLVFAKDEIMNLRFHTDRNTLSQDEFYVHLTEKKIADSIAKIQWRHKVLQMIYAELPNSSKELGIFINRLREQRDDSAIRTCINEFAHPTESEKTEPNREFLRKYDFFPKKDILKTGAIVLRGEELTKSYISK